MLLITDDVPVAYHTDGDMVLAALRRHVPGVMTQRLDAERVRVWLMLDQEGRMERTVMSVEAPSVSLGTYAAALLEPFPGEDMSRFESVGSILIPAGYGPNTIGVSWLQRRADVKPDSENGIYQFDAQRLLPPRSTLEELVKERYPRYAEVGLTELPTIPFKRGEAPPEPNPDEAIVPWFVAEPGGTVIESWLGPYLRNPLIAKQMIQERRPHLRFSSVRIGQIRSEHGSWPPVVWATLEPS